MTNVFYAIYNKVTELFSGYSNKDPDSWNDFNKEWDKEINNYNSSALSRKKNITDLIR